MIPRSSTAGCRIWEWTLGKHRMQNHDTAITQPISWRFAFGSCPIRFLPSQMRPRPNVSQAGKKSGHDKNSHSPPTPASIAVIEELRRPDDFARFTTVCDRPAKRKDTNLVCRADLSTGERLAPRRTGLLQRQPRHRQGIGGLLTMTENDCVDRAFGSARVHRDSGRCPVGIIGRSLSNRESPAFPFRDSHARLVRPTQLHRHRPNHPDRESDW